MKKDIYKDYSSLTLPELKAKLKLVILKIDKTKKKPQDEEMQRIKYLTTCYYVKSIIRDMILNSDMTQKELADYLGLSKGMITEYKLGTAMPSLPIFWMLYLQCQDKVDLKKDYVSEIME